MFKIFNQIISNIGDKLMTEITPLPTMQLKPFTGLINDKRSEGWELLEDVDVQGNPILELVEFLGKGENQVIGKSMFDRAVKIGNRAGQQHAERLLTQQHEIPEEWRKFYLVFPGTKWHYPSNVSPIVPVLTWDVDLWYLYLAPLVYRWGSRNRLVRYKYSGFEF